MNNIAELPRLRDVVADYETKRDNIPQAIAAYEAAQTSMNEAACILGVFGDSLGMGNAPNDWVVKDALLKSAWRAVYTRLQIDRIATAKDRKQFETSFANPPEFTLENIAATFGDYLADPRGNILRGLAEVFSTLDDSYKSHSKVKIGVDGLPKRVIINAVQSDWGGTGYGADRMGDVISAVRAYRGKPKLEYGEVCALASGEVAETDGITVKLFKNGNAHLIFDKQTLLDINRALAEYYGEVLPDTPDEKPTRNASTAVSKDLQYYPTPEKVARSVVEEINFTSGMAILEPSCGDGRLMEAVRDHLTGDYYRADNRPTGCKMMGIEVDRARAEQAKAKGFGVVVDNFLQCQFAKPFDVVIMNPPFYGRHYLKHIAKAIENLADGGELVAILPASAWYDHKELPDDGRSDYSRWRDLPTGSFSESGTNVQTGVWSYIK